MAIANYIVVCTHSNSSGEYRLLQWFQLQPPLKEHGPIIGND